MMRHLRLTPRNSRSFALRLPRSLSKRRIAHAKNRSPARLAGGTVSRCLREFEPAYAALKKVRTVFTIHNLALQGIRPLEGDDSSVLRLVSAA